MRKLFFGVVGSFLTCAGAVYGFISYDDFRSIRMIAAQEFVRESLGYEFAREATFFRSGFRHMFLEPDQYAVPLDEVLMSAEPSSRVFRVAANLSQCRNRGELYRLAKNMVDALETRDAAKRIEALLIPDPAASTYLYKSDIDPTYLDWLRFVETNNTEGYLAERGLSNIIADGRFFYTGVNPNPDAHYYPLIRCTGDVNVADSVVRSRDPMERLVGSNP